MPDYASNSSLLQAVASKDSAAFRRLYDSMSPRLLTISMRICRDRSMAEDALQEAFTDIWKKAATFDPNRGSAEAWMAVVTRNRAIDSVRRRGRNPARTDDFGEVDPIELLADGTQPLDGGTEYMALAECLQRIDERSRETVLLAYHYGLTREELGQRFETPVNTIKTWLRRGLENLRTCLSE